MKGIDTPQYDQVVLAGKKIAIVVTRWNQFIVEKLLQAATEHLIANGIAESDIVTIMCPGAYEVPLMCQHVAASKKYDAIILAVSHDDFIAMGVDELRSFTKDINIIYDLKYLLPIQESDLRL